MIGQLPEDPAALRDAYAYPEGRRWLRANMVASADGAAVAGDRSGGLGGPGDRRLFRLLRGLADVVVVGAGTVRVEGYGPVGPDPAWRGLREGRPAAPPLAIVSRTLDLDLDAPVFTEAREPTILLTAEAAGAARLAAARRRAEVIVAGDGAVDPAAALDALAGRGHTRLLTEGGPRLLAQFVAAGLLDELCLTLSPTLLGGPAFRVLNGPAVADAPGLRLAGALRDEDFLFLRYEVKR